MTNILKLEKERKKLLEKEKELKRIYEMQEKQAKTDIRIKEEEIVKYYEDFFLKQKDKEFKLYDKFPNKEALEIYIRYNHDFPLNLWQPNALEAGSFNAKELAELIKQFYQYKRQEDFNIFTLGVTSEDIRTETCFPHLYFLIGNKKTLNPYEEFNGKYFDNNDYHLAYHLDRIKKEQIIVLPLIRNFDSEEYDIDITVSIPSCRFFNKPNRINYFNNDYNYQTSQAISKNFNIFKHLDHANKISNNYQGIKDVLSFEMTRKDAYIANILLSISMYKHNNQKTELTKEDYNHIFKELYNEEVDIIDKANKDIPKSLVYVPKEKEETVF